MYTKRMGLRNTLRGQTSKSSFDSHIGTIRMFWNEFVVNRCKPGVNHILV